MPDAFPDTPASLLLCLEQGRGGIPDQDAWQSFYDLYHQPIRHAVLTAFRRCHWTNVPEGVLEETIADVVVSFSKAAFSYDPAKGKFRNYLRQLAVWRVCDTIAKSPKIHAEQLEVLETTEAAACEMSGEAIPGKEMERREREAYRSALLATMLEDVRNRVSPQTFMMFELTKIQGQSPDDVAAQFKVKRNVVDNAAYRVLSKLKELAALPEYRKEYFE